MSHWPGTAGWWPQWAGSHPCRSRLQSERMSFRPGEILCHYWECQDYHTGQLQEGMRDRLRQKHWWIWKTFSAVKDQYMTEWESKVLAPTFAEGLRARPGPIGETHPLWRANEFIALWAGKVDFGTDPEIGLFSWTVRGNTRITTRTSNITYRERKKEINLDLCNH